MKLSRYISIISFYFILFFMVCLSNHHSKNVENDNKNKNQETNIITIEILPPDDDQDSFEFNDNLLDDIINFSDKNNK
ncbi:conserved Plasmodium protein, unknown function [Plasmodium yoelii]|uniref:Uncharacterized protein n=1 Tax=Plasmodium yoelii TaxID=5861 RepID=A0A078K5J8_PLAYE|nr:conserved Plasmodium protein, unknown function [Plasmodium yoelii]CDU16823.1 conserved Plasmodium protein, unknown function [Plasmodium yoelii]VTZ74472.1 conserved Plasmodium protein, unknown function [Plasmodium yoelii]|eukprot:XP_022811714.1 conserved Plasmodium protein, unknown function [Plasmodium yoelii]